VLEGDLPEHRDPALYDSDLDALTRLREPENPEKQHADFCTALQRAYVRSSITLSDAEPYRVRVAYRWVREAAMLKNLVAVDQLLSDALLDIDCDPWHDGDLGTLPIGKGYVRMRGDVVRSLLPPDGLPLLPPIVPPEWWDASGVPMPAYSPDDDSHLLRWVDTFERVVTYLGVMGGTADNPDAGRWGLYGLLDPETVRLCFPSVTQILTWEEILVGETWRQLVSRGQVGVERWLRHSHGLTDHEAVGLIRMARSWGIMAHQTDPDSDRLIVSAQLDDIALRAREGALPDIRAELAARKAQAVVKGLTRGDSDQFQREVRDAVFEVVSEGQPATTPARLLPRGD
jgi:hypothetical protein